MKFTFSRNIMTRTCRMDFHRKKRQLEVASSWQEMRTGNSSTNKPNTDITQFSTEIISRKTCLKCKMRGHLLENCPVNKEMIYSSVCFNCGSVEHTLKKCTEPRDGNILPYATCFICTEMGHLASKCPQNRNGVYPFGGGCRKCGSNEHKQNDCTALRKRKDSQNDDQNLSTLKIVPNKAVSADAEDFNLPLQTKLFGKSDESTFFEEKVPQKKTNKPICKPKIVKFWFKSDRLFSNTISWWFK